MPILRHIGQLATCRAEGAQHDIHTIDNAALVWRGSTVTWLGRDADLPPSRGEDEEIDAGGRLVAPGLVDCHTHLAFAGWRADEFEQRLTGASYLDIARAGGGILRTVRDTRAASFDELVARALSFIGEMATLGVTTIEAKSGYGLTPEAELKLLRVYRALSASQPVRIVSTLLGAHIIPPEYAETRADYVRLVCDEMIPRVAAESLAAFCDVFVEDGAFTADDARVIAAAGRRHGLAPKLHVDQLRDGAGAALAAELDAVSADHLEHVSAAGIEALRRTGTVAVSLPIATATLGQPAMPARALMRAGVPVAVATDFNPGSAASFDLPLALWLACTLQRMTPAEALKGATIIAARALGLDARVGSLEPGKWADFVLIDAEDVRMWLYHHRPGACLASWISGERVVRPGCDA
jgi:imidazolonepropionase